MKQNIINRAKKSRYLYSIIILLFCVNVSFSQAIERQYEKEINVPSGSEIFVSGPGNLPFQAEGKLKINTLNGYALEPRDNEGIAAFVANKLDIGTSKNDVLIQVVTIKVIPHEKSKEDAVALVEALEINISKDGNTYTVDNNLNIKELSFKNGFFQGVKNIVVLDDGSTYNVRGLEISASVIVPRDVKLSVTSKYIDVAIADFWGALAINADKSNVKLNDVTNLYGLFNSCKVKFKNIDNANIIAYNSAIKGNTIKVLDLGTEPVVLKETLFGNTIKASLTSYNINNVAVLNIVETSNDEFKIGELGTLEVKSSHFSNYEIKRLKNTLSIKAKNGNVTIDAVSKDVTKLTIDNKISSIYLGVQELDDYTIRFPKLEYTEKTIPNSARSGSVGDVLTFSKGSSKDKGVISISCQNCKIDIKD